LADLWIAMSLKKMGRSPYWRDELLDLEQRLLDPSVRGSPQAVIPLLHPDFVEFGSSGRVYTKDVLVEMMLHQSPGVVRIRDFEVKEVTPEVALVTYKTVGAEGRETRRSSVWVRHAEGWQILFHQGTRVHDRPQDRQVS
jgi:hypothetical protein